MITGWIGGAVILCGVCVVLLAVVGALRLEEFFERIHVYGVIDTLGAGTVMSGVIIMHIFDITALKILMMMLFSFFTTSIGTSLLANIAVLEET